MSLVLLTIVWALAIGGWWHSTFALAAATLLYAVLQGRFDGELAFHRAKFANGSYARLGLSRGLLLVLCALLAAIMFRNAVGVMVGMSLALLLASVIVRRELHGALKIKSAEYARLRERAKELATYGAFTAASSVFTFAFPAVARTVVAKTLSPVDAAAFIFALDLALKAFAIAGLAINVLFLQVSVRAFDQADAQSKKEGVLRTHLVTVAALVFPAMALACGSRELAIWLVPAPLMGGFHRCYVWTVVAAGLLAFRQFGMDPAFFVAKQPKLSCVAPISTFAVFLLLIAGLGLRGSWSIESAAGMLVLSVLASCLVAKVVLRRVSSALLAWRPLLRILVCSVCAYVLAWAAVTSKLSPPGKMLLLCVIGGLTYAAVFVFATPSVLRKRWAVA